MKVNEKKPDFRPEGIVHVYCNGKPVLENGTWLGGRFGEIAEKENRA